MADYSIVRQFFIYKIFYIVDIIGSIDDKIESNNKLIDKIKELLHLKTSKLVLLSNENILLESLLTEKVNRIKQEYTPYSVVNTGEIIKQVDQFDKKIAVNTINKYKELKQYDFAYNPSRINIGSIGMMEDDIGCVSPIYTVFKVNDRYKYYFKELLNFDFIKNEIIKRCSGSVRQALPFKELTNISIPLISDTELNNYNKSYLFYRNVINKIQQETNLLKKQKNNYLNKFFN